MDIQCTERARCLIVRIDGEIDHHTADMIRTQVDKQFARSTARHIIFDLEAVRFMDSSGIGMIIGRYRALESMGGKVFAVRLDSGLNRLFEISGLKKIIICHADVDAALADAKGGQHHAG